MREKAWKGADDRHDFSRESVLRNSRKNELLDHYSVGADNANTKYPWAGTLGSMLISGAMEMTGRPVLAAHPELGNKLMPDTFNFKTKDNNRTGAIDPYKMPTWRESAENFGATAMGALDKYPRVRKLFGWGDD
jgi:hypothetical protein